MQPQRQPRCDVSVCRFLSKPLRFFDTYGNSRPCDRELLGEHDERITVTFVCQETFAPITESSDYSTLKSSVPVAKAGVSPESVTMTSPMNSDPDGIEASTTPERSPSLLRDSPAGQLLESIQ